MLQPCSYYKPLATKLTSKHSIIRWSWWNQTEDQTGPIQIHHLWGRHWTHSFSWKPTSSSVLNFFPQPRQTFVCERKPWKFVSRLRCWLANCPAAFLSYFHCGFVMKYSWQIQRSQWAIQVGWVGQFTTVGRTHSWAQISCLNSFIKNLYISCTSLEIPHA